MKLYEDIIVGIASPVSCAGFSLSPLCFYEEMEEYDYEEKELKYMALMDSVDEAIEERKIGYTQIAR
ncbi:hypothetical protein E2C01_021963 [Portunus trituberculatus]|uniref:Uncharacterized protein n=1 Tax=Portunus trituberculatus TaxID=210409 RepID=A0A5B7E3Z3_PORTR|nr:hypothetical protein [Portunus trituberculatus]